MLNGITRMKVPPQGYDQWFVKSHSKGALYGSSLGKNLNLSNRCMLPLLKKQLRNKHNNIDID
jgi:hypothetical protein